MKRALSVLQVQEEKKVEMSDDVIAGKQKESYIFSVVSVSDVDFETD